MKKFEFNRTSDIWAWFTRELDSFYPEREAHAIAAEVFKRLFDLSPDKRVLGANQPFPEASVLQVERALAELREGMPVQYVTGFCGFLDTDIRVRPGVLIPRPETEELVVWVVRTLEAGQANAGKDVSILDLGTGSGCIAIALARRFPEARVQACDMNRETIQLAENNALLNRVNVSFLRLDLLDPAMKWSPEKPVDCIVSNPPYVRNREKEFMFRNVLDYEPPEALFVPDDDPLLFYKAISIKAVSWLRPGGLIFFEINEALGEETVSLLQSLGFGEVTLKKDFFGKDRFVRGINP
ncbi:MAG: peptide chain release factor N(5)-glutamine methyltransferase [Bacteroidales bacterium]